MAYISQLLGYIFLVLFGLFMFLITYFFSKNKDDVFHNLIKK